MVGAVRFELTTSCTRNKRASQATLRPDKAADPAGARRQMQHPIFSVQCSRFTVQYAPPAAGGWAWPTARDNDFGILNTDY